MRSLLSTIALAGLLTCAGTSSAGVAQDELTKRFGPPNFLTNNTLVYTDDKGQKNSIYFGRFGNFDWYFPCQVVTGSWKLAPDGALNLSYDSPERAPRQYNIAPRDDAYSLTASDSANPSKKAEILAGYRLPFG